MIRTFRHKGLRKLYRDSDPSGVSPERAARIKVILTRLDAAANPGDMDLPGLRLHPLKGKLKGLFAVQVSGNWRIIFRFDETDAVDVDLVDYH